MKSTNLTYANILTVEETCTYKKSSNDPQTTIFSQEVQINSFNAMAHFRNMIEDFCVKRFQANAQRGKAALENVLEKAYP